MNFYLSLYNLKKLFPEINKSEFIEYFGFDYDTLDPRYKPVWVNRYRKKKYELLNHEVVKVEFIEEKEDVYDIEVEDNHTFALAAGVFVHNSKDACDAFCGAMFTASKFAEEFAYDYGESYDLLIGSNTQTNMTNSSFATQRQMMIDFENELRKQNPLRPPTKQEETKITEPMIIDDTLIW